MEINRSNPKVAWLLSLRNAPKSAPPKQRGTNLAIGQVTNPDFIILALHILGPFGLTEIRQLSEAWKGTKNWALQTYFGPTQGYTCQAFNSRNLYVQGYTAGGGCKGPERPWYRVHGTPGKTRYVNALSLDGLKRLAEMVSFIPQA